MTSALVTRGKFSRPYETFHLNASLYIYLALVASLDLLKENIFPRLCWQSLINKPLKKGTLTTRIVRFSANIWTKTDLTGPCASQFSWQDLASRLMTELADLATKRHHKTHNLPQCR